MGLFSFTQELAMDLGTANTIITCNDKMVVDEPSVIALDARSEKVLAVGRQAREMYEKTNPNIRTIRPLREGVIAMFWRPSLWTRRAHTSRLSWLRSTPTSSTTASGSPRCARLWMPLLTASRRPSPAMSS